MNARRPEQITSNHAIIQRPLTRGRITQINSSLSWYKVRIKNRRELRERKKITARAKPQTLSESKKIDAPFCYRRKQGQY